ncbi:hypothetical protein [Chenggangzhangella methanolivorans]|uniref:Uncharacterized protein n=1 Tax=Chenggangzhangella methanolivorans TaxID=1437009 RepID=A0A9E6UI70_9HYPH|nr:hypothetical protein [Chenggangzhangella methanolivorans]QZO00513.1 hypothetical protein K6K41_01895 [Chenggangzhangella methanolivorans]
MPMSRRSPRLAGRFCSPFVRSAGNAAARSWSGRSGRCTPIGPHATIFRRPDDLRTGVREVVNSFVKPWGAQGFQVIDPSVLDLLNAVARNAPDNAVDLIAGAASFHQIDQVWTLAKADQGGAIISALRREAGRIAPTIGRLAKARRRVASDSGGVGYYGPTYERRLATIIEMVQRLEAPAIAELIAPAFERLLEEWRTERPQINDAVEWIRAIDGAPPLMMTNVDGIRGAVLDAVLEEARTGCRADELRELLGVVDTEQARREVAVARESFARYQQDHFLQDLSECRSREQFSGLIEDLELFRDQLDVDVRAMIERVEEANAEFAEQEDTYADHMHDEWQERYRDERAGDRSIADMFGSLRGNRS